MRKLKKLKGRGKQGHTTKGKKSKFVFFIGDEGGILSYMQGNIVVRRLYAPDASPENTQAMRELINNNPKADIYMLVDMIDQSYIKQSLPPVTKFSVQKLIKRRLERDFAPEDITGALPLGREKEGRRDWNYLLISLSSSPQFMEWVELALSFDNIFKGIFLVPVESEQFIKQLVKHHLGKEKSKWQFLVCHNKVGGFRQVILKDGRLTFTRLAQPIGDITPEVIAGNIEQEVTNTIEYMKRLSYREDEGLDIFIIVSADIKKSLDKENMKASNVIIMTPSEVSEILALPQAAMPEDHYADVVFSAFFGSSKSHVLTLHTKYSKKLITLYTARILAMIAGAAITTLLLLVTAMSISRILPIYDRIETLKQEKTTIEQQLKQTTTKAKSLPDDLNKITDVLSIYERLDNDRYFPLKFARDFAAILNENIIVRAFAWRGAKNIAQRFDGEQPPLSVEIEVEFLNNDIPIKKFTQEAQEFFELIETNFPDYYFTHSALPGANAQQTTFQTKFDDEIDQQLDVLPGKPIYITLSFKTEKPRNRR